MWRSARSPGQSSQRSRLPPEERCTPNSLTLQYTILACNACTNVSEWIMSTLQQQGVAHTMMCFQPIGAELRCIPRPLTRGAAAPHVHSPPPTVGRTSPACPIASHYTHFNEGWSSLPLHAVNRRSSRSSRFSLTSLLLSVPRLVPCLHLLPSTKIIPLPASLMHIGNC